MPDFMSWAIANLDTTLRLEPEELGGILIQQFNELPPSDAQLLNRHNFLNSWGMRDCPREKQTQLEHVLAEAWAWLERECLIALRPNAGGSYGYFITRRGKKLVDKNAFEAYRRASALPRFLLHPQIDARAYPSFLRGAYDTAVFEAFREIEVAVRIAGGFGAEKYGKQLMREGFSAAGGPLADRTALKAEQEAMADLFAGAIGLYKNASSHRAGTVSDPHLAA
jgi:uncharacterized protein (TIGR02391 family)